MTPFVPLLGYRINLDTIEGINRVAEAFNIQPAHVSPDAFAFHGQELWIRRECVDTVDRFWLLKDFIYSSIINRVSNIMFERWLSDTVSRVIPQGVLSSFEAFDDVRLLSIVPIASAVEHLAFWSSTSTL